MRNGIVYRVARGLASRLRLKQPSMPLLHIAVPGRQGIGFSPEIETFKACILGGCRNGVARGLASRLRLKPFY